MNLIKYHLGIILSSLILFSCLVSAGSLQVTPEHPFLINNSWIYANQLKVGDLLTTIDGKQARITSIEDVKLNQSVLVYNLEDDYFHNYIVSGLIVHNSGRPSIPELKTIEVEEFPTSPWASKTLTHNLETIEVAQDNLNNLNDWANIAKYKLRTGVYWDGVIYKDGTNYLYNPNKVGYMQIIVKILTDKGLINPSKFVTYSDLVNFVEQNYGSDFLYVSFSDDIYFQQPYCSIPKFSLAGSQWEGSMSIGPQWTQWQIENQIPIKKSFYDYVKNKWAPQVKFSDSDVPAQIDYLTRGGEAGWYGESWFNLVP